MPTYTVVCQICSKTFTAKRGYSQIIPKYCSRHCVAIGQRKQPQTFTCQQCGKNFQRKDHIKRRKPKYCSGKCVGLSQRTQTFICEYCGREYTRRGKAAREMTKYCSKKCSDAAKKRTVTFICEYCGKHIELQASVAKKRKYCSRECSSKAQRKKITVTCPICKKSFESKSSRKAKYCSRKCACIGRAKEFSGPNHDLWKSIECICQTCGNAFYCKPSELEKGYGKHCSMECRKMERVECVCEFCGESFYKLPSQIEPEGYGRFCSQSCRSKHTVRQLHITSPTSIEQALLDELDCRNIEYEFQYPLKDWVFDFAFPLSKLVVEADGVYWHSLPHVAERDARKDADLQAQDWTVLRFTGDEIRESPQRCVDEIVKVLK